MPHPRVMTLVLVAGAIACASNEPTPPPGDGGGNDPPDRWQSFQLSTLQQQRAAQGVGYLQFLDASDVTMGLYHLAAGAVDGQEAHGRDEVYYVVSGTAVVDVEGTDYPVEAGSVVWVKANADHRFHNITEALDVLVIFANGTPNPGDATGLVFTLDEIVAPRDAGQNVWNQFLTMSTMSLGMYLLPQSLGGDQTLTHTFGEVNIMVDGAGKFTVGDDTIDVLPGTIMYVESGVGHQFHALTGDIDVLIWWER